MRLCVEDPSKEKKILDNIELHCSDIALTKTVTQKLIYLYLKLKLGISTIIMGETGVGKTCLVRYLSQMIQSLVFTLDVHAGRTQKDIIKWIKHIIYLNKNANVEFLQNELDKIKKI